MSNIKKYFIQKENTLFTLFDCNMIIDLSYYDKGDTFIKSESDIWVKSLISKVKINNDEVDVVLDYPVNIVLENTLIEEFDEYISIQFKKDHPVLDVTSGSGDIGKQISYVERLLGGREIVKDPSHLLKKLLGIYSPPNADFDIVHLEILLSQVLRNKTDVQKLARLVSPYEPTLVNIKKVVFSSGFVQGLAFENIGEAIRTGLIQEDENEPSILEKVVTGTLVEPAVKTN